MKKRNGSENIGLKIAGIVPTPDEERLQLMKTVLHWPEDKAQEMLKRSNARRPAYLQQDEPKKISCGMTVEELNEAQLKMVGLLPATDEERIQIMIKILELTEEEATALLNKMQERRRGGG